MSGKILNFPGAESQSTKPASSPDSPHYESIHMAIQEAIGNFRPGFIETMTAPKDEVARAADSPSGVVGMMGEMHASICLKVARDLMKRIEVRHIHSPDAGAVTMQASMICMPKSEFIQMLIAIENTIAAVIEGAVAGAALDRGEEP